MSARTVLIADDEAHIRELVKLYLQNDGFRLLEASTGPEALALWKESSPDLVILDIMLPELDGWEVLKQIRREKNTPVIMLTARGEEVDRVLGLELGADDYVVKPFSPRELVSRVKAILRRAGGEPPGLYHIAGADSQTSGMPGHATSQVGGSHSGTGLGDKTYLQGEVLEYPGLAIDKASREVTVRGRILTLPPKEFDLLWLLASNPNRVFTREFLLETVWEYSYVGDIRTVDVHIRRLRQKIEEDPENPRYLKTVWGVGYKFEYHPPSRRETEPRQGRA
ncbi:MAG: response regulator transcription factor [Firmicutes bacterium]|nr:response regulator transcription factor [Candidatus Fermentithermobacillaceae bacterium]